MVGSLTKSCQQEELEQALYELQVYGYSKINNYLSNAALNELLGVVEFTYKEIKSKGLGQYPGAPERDIDDKIIYNIQNYNNLFIDIITTDLIKRIGMANLNDPYYRFLPVEAPNYILTYYNARSSGSALDLHIDSYVPFMADKPIMMQFVILLEDSTELNGCTVVVPGSHQSGKYTNRDLTKTTPLVGKAGDLIFWDSRLWHGTLENQSKVSRWALIATMGMWWIKQSMDMPRSLPDYIYKKCTLEQKQLLGFCSMPPVDPFTRTNTKTGYEFLKENKDEYNF